MIRRPSKSSALIAGAEGLVSWPTGLCFSVRLSWTASRYAMRTCGAFPVRWAFVFLLCCLAGQSSGQLSKPVAHDTNMKDEAESNKYLSREASDDMLPIGKL